MDILDPALLRSGRLDRKIEFPMPNEEARARIMQIHSRKMNVRSAATAFSAFNFHDSVLLVPGLRSPTPMHAHSLHFCPLPEVESCWGSDPPGCCGTQSHLCPILPLKTHRPSQPSRWTQPKHGLGACNQDQIDDLNSDLYNFQHVTCVLFLKVEDKSFQFEI